ncbi:CRISPR-associated endonuclease Cas2 [Falsiroseomonas sp. CW058]|uniref:CRISPR-associated endonuclease Cas2 n=1 Tax=Falsiroseomonas sp. CW058 TaxID=3388664 RepID=UPI003D31E346
MWLLVMFDLPVGTKAQRRQATAFRNWLLGQGYEMSQFSVYMRFCAGKEQVERRIRDIGRNLPGTGSIHVLSVTDRQFAQMATFRGRQRGQGRSAPEQLALF